MKRTILGACLLFLCLAPISASAQTDFSLSTTSAVDITTTQVGLFISSTPTDPNAEYTWEMDGYPNTFGCGIPNNTFPTPTSDINATDTLDNLTHTYDLDSCGGTSFDGAPNTFAGSIILLEFDSVIDAVNGDTCSSGYYSDCLSSPAYIASAEIDFSGYVPPFVNYVCVLYSDADGDCAYYAIQGSFLAPNELPINEDEELFVFGIFLFIFSIPVWERLFTITKSKYEI